MECPSETPLGETTVTNRGIRVFCTINVHEDPVSNVKHYILPLSYRTGDGRNLSLRLRKIGGEIFLREDPTSLFQYKKTIQVHALKPRYLVVEPPERQDLDLLPQPVVGQEYLRHFRRAVLQLHNTASVTILDYHGVYDVEDGIFFRAPCMSPPSVWLRFSLRLDNLRGTNRVHSYDTDCVIYVLGWGAGTRADLHCRLVDCKACPSQVGAVQADFANWEYDPDRGKERLDEHGIPDSTDMITQIPDTNSWARVYLKCSYFIRDNVLVQSSCELGLCYEVKET